MYTFDMANPEKHDLSRAVSEMKASELICIIYINNYFKFNQIYC